jgi:outer membrane protein assembly factor BamB
VATKRYGKVFGIDSTNGEVVWSRVLGFGGSSDVDDVAVLPVKMFVVRTVSDDDGGKKEKTVEGPQLVLITQKRTGDVCFPFAVSHLGGIN